VPRLISANQSGERHIENHLRQNLKSSSWGVTLLSSALVALTECYTRSGAGHVYLDIAIKTEIPGQVCSPQASGISVSLEPARALNVGAAPVKGRGRVIEGCDKDVIFLSNSPLRGRSIANRNADHERRIVIAMSCLHRWIRRIAVSLKL
jgi:hypothetical protein